MWSNLCAAYDGLSAPMQELCEGLTALHDALPHNRPDKMAIHPVIRVHPVSGRKALYVNEHFTRRIVEMNATESETLLGYLTNWIKSPRFTVRYRWRADTIGMWDNQGETPIRGDWPVYADTCYAIEGNVKAPVKEWDDQLVQIKLEQSACFDGDNVLYLAGRQTEWHFIQ